MGLFLSVKKFMANVQNGLEDAVIESSGIYDKDQHERHKAVRADMQREWIGEEDEGDGKDRQ